MVYESGQDNSHRTSTKYRNIILATKALPHHLRAKMVPQEWCEAWDEAVLSFWELEMQRNLALHQRW